MKEIIILIILGIIIILWLAYWRYIHPKLKFKELDYIKNETLLKLNYESLNQTAYHTQMIGFSFMVAGFTITEKGNIAMFTSMFGLLIILLSLISEGRAERRMYWLKEKIKKDGKNKKR